MTQRRPQSRYNYDQAHRQVEPAPSVQKVPTVETREDWDERLRLQEQAKARLTEMRGSDQSVILVDTLEAPWADPGDPRPAFAVVTFTVPQGRVLVVDGIGWKLSDPFLQGSTGYEIEIFVDGAAIPYWQDGTRITPGGVGFGFPFGSMPFILDIEPIYVQSNSTLSINLRRFDVTFVEFVAVGVIVRGNLVKPVGGL